MCSSGVFGGAGLPTSARAAVALTRGEEDRAAQLIGGFAETKKPPRLPRAAWWVSRKNLPSQPPAGRAGWPVSGACRSCATTAGAAEIGRFLPSFRGTYPLRSSCAGYLSGRGRKLFGRGSRRER